MNMLLKKIRKDDAKMKAITMQNYYDNERFGRNFYYEGYVCFATSKF